MDNKIDVSNEALDFLTGIHCKRSDEELRREAIFNRSFELAYKDMSTHTVEYSEKNDAKSPYNKYINDNSVRCTKNKEKIRNAIKGYVKQRILDSNLSQLKGKLKKEQFDEWHKQACEEFVKINCKVSGLKSKDKNGEDENPCLADFFIKKGIGENIFTIGQAQKLINMMLKYLYIFYQCEGLKTLEELNDCAHVPIDRYVLEAVFYKENYKGTPWSQIATYDDYINCKKEIENYAESKDYANGFQWELAEWPFNEK